MWRHDGDRADETDVVVVVVVVAAAPVEWRCKERYGSSSADNARSYTCCTSARVTAGESISGYSTPPSPPPLLWAAGRAIGDDDDDAADAEGGC